MSVAELELPATSLAAQVFWKAFADGWRRDPDLTVSEWADEYRHLSSATSPEPARWRTSRTPHIKKIMDSLSPMDPAREVVVQGPAQGGKSEGGYNWVGRTIHLSPCPFLIVRPRTEDAENDSQERIMPMIALSPVLSALVGENRSRDGENKILVKKFRGGLLAMTGANSATGLRARPICNIFFDEVDAYPEDVDGEGDPIALAMKRTTNYQRRRKILISSTPTEKGHSRIESEFLKTDQQRYFVPCPHCENFDILRWSALRRADGTPYADDDTKGDTSGTVLLCHACGCLIEERYKTQMLAGGEWRATASPEVQASAAAASRVGFHFNALYSPLGWLSWSDIAKEFQDTRNDRPQRKTWVNTRLAETWDEEEDSDSVDPKSLLARANERYAADVPNGVGVLVAAVDVQKDRLEWKVVGYGAGEESWLIATGQVPGDPGMQKTWLELDQVLTQSWKHESGQTMRIWCTAIDSRYKSDMVYRFCRARLNRRVFAVRGGNAIGLPLVGRPKVNNPYRARVYHLCVDTGKETVYSRLRIMTPGPGFMHLPEGVDQEYIDQLTSERPFKKWIKRKGYVRQWEKLRARNEAWDLEVYCKAALDILGPLFSRTLATRAARLQSPVLQFEAPEETDSGELEAPSPAPAPRAPKPRGRPRGSWATGGKGWKV